MEWDERGCEMWGARRIKAMSESREKKGGKRTKTLTIRIVSKSAGNNTCESRQKFEMQEHSVSFV